MIIYLRLLKESFAFAINALRNNKLRTLLSLLGVTIGIFSIIAVLAAVDSLDKKISKDLSSLDKNTIYLMKYCFGPSDIPEWKREQFPNVKYDEYINLKNSLNNTDQVGFQLFVSKEVLKYDSKTVADVNIIPSSFEMVNVDGLSFEKGRFYNESESNSGTPVIVLGYDIAEGLFENEDPVGKNIRLYGQRFTVIGVIEKQGAGFFGDSNDTSVYLPANFLRRMYGDSDSMTPVIVLKPAKGIDIEAYKAEVAQKLRAFRGMKAGDADNFFINILSGFTDFIDGILGGLRMGGVFISFFSFLVGGFGVANIMFVSVKERTNLIGIQKSLGARNKFILFQFLFEAVVLCVIGGTVGILMVGLLSLLLSSLLDFDFVLSFGNVIIGAGLSIVVGVISGILPAISASKLDPVEAIRTGM